MSTLGFVGQEALICLRCQYRLSLRRRPRPKQRQIPQQVRHFGRDRRLHQEQTPVKDVDSYDQSFAPSQSQPQPNFTITYQPYKAPSKALSFRRLNDLPPPKDSLGFESLGQPAEVLILKDLQRRGHHDKPLQGTRSSQTGGDLPTEAMSSSDMLKEMNAERGIIGIDQVCKNIDALKDEWTRALTDLKLPWEATGSVVTKRRYDEVVARLSNGFTISQLAAYLDRNENMQLADPLDLHNQFSSTLYARSPWTPGTTDIWRSRAPTITELDQGGMSAEAVVPDKIEKQVPRKNMLIDRILRYCWRIRPKEDESSLGEMDIRLQAPHLELIVNHKRSILKQISESYGAKVEASSRDQVIRVTSDHDTCLDILKLIIHTLGNIKSSAISLPDGFKGVPQSQGPVADKDTHEAIIAQVMQLTNTIIRENAVLAQKKELNIYYLGPDDEDLEDARRLVSQILQIRPTKERRLLMGAAIRQSRDLLVPIDVGTGLSLTERTQQWSRWCSRSTRQIDLKSQREGAAVRLNTLENPLDRKTVARALNQFFAAPADNYETSKATVSHWVSNISYWDSALLGQVLFPALSSKRATKSDSGLQPKLAKWQRGFVTLVPGLVRTLEDFALDTTDPTSWDEEFLLIRLIPSFKNSLPVPLEVVPELEIRIFFDESSKTTSIRDVRLVRRSELDLLLPQNTMDLRFIRRACVYSRKGGLDAQIMKFVQDSNLDIWGTGRLKTPTNLTISIPPHALGPISDGRSSEGFEREQVEYTFASLEHRCEIGIPFRQPGSWANLTYTSIEGGKIGGRRDELGLKQPRRMKNAHQMGEDGDLIDDEATIDDEQHSASLLRKANALINTIETPPDNTIKQPSVGMGSIQRRVHRARVREQKSQLASRNRLSRERSRPSRRPAFEDLTRRVPARLIRNIKA